MAIFPTNATYTDVNNNVYTMTSRKPDKGLSYTNNFIINSYTTQAGYSRRLLRSRQSLRTFNLTYTTITGYYKNALENFYKDRFGSFEAFTFDLTYINLDGSCTVIFSEEDFSITKVLDNGTDEVNFYNVNFNLKEVYQ